MRAGSYPKGKRTRTKQRLREALMTPEEWRQILGDEISGMLIAEAHEDAKRERKQE